MRVTGSQQPEEAHEELCKEQAADERVCDVGLFREQVGAGEKAVDEQAAEEYHRPRQPPAIQGDSGECADQRQGRAHRQIDTAGGNDQSHSRRDDQQRGALTDDIQPVGAGEKVAGDQRKHHAAEDEKERAKNLLPIVEDSLRMEADKVGKNLDRMIEEKEIDMPAMAQLLVEMMLTDHQCAELEQIKNLLVDWKIRQ